jgi:hypothetical protein
MRASELARVFKEREERVLRAFQRRQATAYEVQYWACLTALAACKSELGTFSPNSVLRRLHPPGSRAA